MKTLQPLILTARICNSNLKRFDRLRQERFPPNRNFLAAHLTMFHRLPGEYKEQVVQHLIEVAAGFSPITADVGGVRHLGAGVAFTKASKELHAIHTEGSIHTVAGWPGHAEVAAAYRNPEQGLEVGG